ncbi:response regulator [Maribacter algarum]|uniref:dolichyl-phosphate beta-glucosyltransferase n=1 Tax=Maribacter algarum (ex Zhang et al. 2020) TaxID=2578118 RepID=A0A5S3PPJ5_9FLAO|nr:response regulator [Maribacter algarum]TMM56666.1 response regulator [Maribacter algarum]
MKILTIDDQQLILLSVEKRLTELGYEVETANSGKSGIAAIDAFDPDMVIVDINMPDLSGIEVIQHIRIVRKLEIPILVMSGNTNEKTILESYNLGIDDYMKKPVSLDEMVARINRILGNNFIQQYTETNVDTKIIGQFGVGVVIPCYNEENRLSSALFQDFIDKNVGYHLCFVNDGSTDNTLEVLKKLRKGNEDTISIFDCEKNGGKAEAVRQGIQYLIANKEFEYIGYLDADLSTDFRDFDDLVKTIGNSNFKIVSGSRIARMGANIAKESARKIISKSINFIIQAILGMPFKDTQCGAKVMDKEIASLMFQKKFITKWLFDVEIFMRMRKHYGKNDVKKLICEQPLKRWVHVDDSKLSMKDSVKIVGQLGQIALHYK